jgi:hypothetical protein
MDEKIDAEESQDQAPTEGTFKRVFLAPGRAMVAVHNLMSRQGQKLQKGRWSYSVAAWICASMIWLVVLVIVILIPVMLIISAGK